MVTTDDQLMISSKSEPVVKVCILYMSSESMPVVEFSGFCNAFTRNYSNYLYKICFYSGFTKSQNKSSHGKLKCCNEVRKTFFTNSIPFPTLKYSTDNDIPALAHLHEKDRTLYPTNQWDNQGKHILFMTKAHPMSDELVDIWSAWREMLTRDPNVPWQHPSSKGDFSVVARVVPPHGD